MHPVSVAEFNVLVCILDSLTSKNLPFLIDNVVMGTYHRFRAAIKGGMLG